MAITFFQPTNNNANDFSGTVSGAGNSVPSGSGAGVAYAVVHAFHSGAASAPTFTGLGLTWAHIAALNIQTDTDAHIWVYEGTGTLSSATTLSVTGGNMVGAGFSVCQVLGCNTSSPRITTYLADTDGMGVNGTIDFSMSAFENANNAALTFIINLGGYTIDTTDTTQVYNTAGLFGSADHRAAYGAANDNSLSLVPNGAGAAYAAFAIEIDEAAAGGGSTAHIPAYLQMLRSNQ